ncbi:WSC domain-containing protein [Cercophora scortea]|uniref:WSC domain-containing protein n=1 Tax=Cercophora scortea TaxID=314031 RepID=A0AAE0IHF4_9PEZI|nr:WSC domain-containing protein [Cercophora scortea]
MGAAIWLLATAHLATGTALLAKRDLVPNMHTWWYDNWEGKTCLQVRGQYYLSAAAFSRWNPSLSPTCDGWLPNWSYCVEVASEQYSSLTSTSTTTTTTSTPTSTSKPIPTWKPAGCYINTDTKITTLSNKTTTIPSTSMTIAKCKATCYASDFIFTGLTLGTECWCGNSIRDVLASNKTDCNTPCTGSASDICGGRGRISIYEASVVLTPPTTTTTSTPAAATATNWHPLGCYIDASSRTLLNQATLPGGATTLSSSTCTSACAAAGYTLAGTENSNECWCDNAVHTNPRAPDQSGCNKPRLGNATEMCGSDWRLNVYKYTVPALPAGTKHKWLALGCYEDSWAARLLGAKLLVASGGAGNNTRSNCLDACEAAGFAYAGVEYAFECFCDNVMHPPVTLASDGEVSCNSPCSGNQTEMCGGANHINVFLKTSQLA